MLGLIINIACVDGMFIVAMDRLGGKTMIVVTYGLN